MTAAVHFARFKPAIEAALDRVLPPADTPPRELHAAMRYGLLGGGKRLRPVLVALAYEAVGGRGEGYLPPACAVEMVHAYSLIHDDLPAMDDDDLRRGRPTCHKVFGEAVAILAGDALLTRAFEVLATAVPEAAVARRLVAELARAAGSTGLVGGQVLDMAPPGGKARPELLKTIPRLKTAALIRASLRLGALAAGAPEAELERLGRFGEALGLAFQLVDDILDETSTPEALGKTPGKDRRQGKLTFPAVEGVAAARARAAELVARAREALRDWGAAGPLLDVAAFVLERSR